MILHYSSYFVLLTLMFQVSQSSTDPLQLTLNKTFHVCELPKFSTPSPTAWFILSDLHCPRPLDRALRGAVGRTETTKTQRLSPGDWNPLRGTHALFQDTSQKWYNRSIWEILQEESSINSNQRHCREFYRRDNFWLILTGGTGESVTIETVFGLGFEAVVTSNR